jgi:uncharacterized protein YacL
MKQKRIFFQGIGATIGAICLSIISIFILKNIQNMYVGVNFGGDKVIIFGFLFFGIPFGGCLGIFIVDKIFFKFNASLIGFILSLLLCIVIAGLGSVILLSFLGHSALFLIPFLYLTIAFLGYYLPLKSRCS